MLYVKLKIKLILKKLLKFSKYHVINTDSHFFSNSKMFFLQSIKEWQYLIRIDSSFQFSRIKIVRCARFCIVNDFTIRQFSQQHICTHPIDFSPIVSSIRSSALSIRFEKQSAPRGYTYWTVGPSWMSVPNFMIYPRTTTL